MRIIKILLLVFFVLGINNINALLFGQQISGTVFEIENKTPVEFVNISIVGKSAGTVSDKNGNYILQINPEYHNDTLSFSCVGYLSYNVKVSDFMKLNSGNVGLEKRTYNLKEVVVHSEKKEQKGLMQSFWGWLTSCRKKDTEEINKWNSCTN